jgi:hypothetical protein
MTRPILLAAVLAALSAASWPAGAATTPYPPRATLTAFASDQELADLFKRWADEARRRRDEERRQKSAESPAAVIAPGTAPGAVATAPAAAPAKALADSTTRAEADSVTNVQHAGVDEGGIVKVVADHLVILRRGRLFTVHVGDRELRPVATADAFGPDVDPRAAWYDEMLVAGNRVVVIGYSYQRGGTEIGLFDVSPAGAITYRATYHLRSNDYYSSRNYASRLIGDKLVVYSPLVLNPLAPDPWSAFPAMRRWFPGARPGDFKRIAPATRIYRTDEPLDPSGGVALHSVTTCDLARAEMSCESTAVLGPAGRVFYVSPDSVFVWATPWRRMFPPAPAAAATTGSSVFRIPLDGSAPSALKVAGSPIDQFSFLQDGQGHLNVMVRDSGRGDGMWAAEHNRGGLALLRVALASFSDGRDAAPADAYLRLPRPQGYAVQNRFVGSYLLYGGGAGWRRPQQTQDSEIFAVRYADGSGAYAVPLAHGVDRIEALGAHAVAVGSDGANLHFTSLRLGRIPVAAGKYVRQDAAQGETRSHGFFYRRDADEEGLLGLPIIGGHAAAGQQLRKTSASLLYLRSRGLDFRELGTLEARASNQNDACKASCVDWYGNSRPLFLRGRVFALLGYEIVEGTESERHIVEKRRVNFAPGAANLSAPD